MPRNSDWFGPLEDMGHHLDDKWCPLVSLEGVLW